MTTPSFRPLDRVIAHFDRASADYAARRGQEFGFQSQLRIVDRMLAGCSGRLVDLGCGSGAALPLLRQRGFHVVGIDVSPEMLAHARRRFVGERHVSFCRGEAERLPFASDSIDHLVCLGLLEYLDAYEQALSEVARVLRTGGSAIFSIPSGISPYHLERKAAFATWRLVKTLLKKPRVAPLPRNLCVPRRFRRLLSEAGLQPLPNAYCAFFMFPLDMLAPRLHLRLATWLEFLSDVPVLAWTGSQYMVSARKVAAGRTRLPAPQTSSPGIVPRH